MLNNGAGQGDALGADRETVGDVLDVAAGYCGPVLKKQGSSHTEA